MENVDIEKVLVSNETSFGEKNCKYFIGYLYNDHKVKPLRIMLPRTGAYVKNYNEQTNWISFLTVDDDLLEKYNTIINSVLISTKNLIASLSIIKII